MTQNLLTSETETICQIGLSIKLEIVNEQRSVHSDPCPDASS